MNESWDKEEAILAVRNFAESQLRDGYQFEPVLMPQVSKTEKIQTQIKTSVESRSLGDIQKQLGDCTRCQLSRGRKNIVFGEGNPKADLVIVGEAPGADEDERGVPFVGKAGQLLTDIIAAIGLSRSDIYICNVIKCRPPENRPPEPLEIETCSPFLHAQLASISPKMICTLGNIATRTLLQSEVPISRVRGSFQKYKDIPLMPTYHPSYLLRNPAAKKDVWEDMKKLHAELCRLTGKNILRKGT